jgi:hypothetical protein
MNACMHDYAKIRRKYSEFRSTMLELRVTTPFGKDYGFQMYLYHGFYQVPRVINHSRTLSGYGNTSDPTMFVRKSCLSVVSRVN